MTELTPLNVADDPKSSNNPRRRRCHSCMDKDSYRLGALNPSIGDRVCRISDRSHVGTLTAIFETLWDTANQGAMNTRTVGTVDYDNGTCENVFLDQLVKA